MYRSNLIRLIKLIFINIFIALFILAVARLVLLISAVDTTQLSVYKKDLLHVFFLGGRFDIKVAAIAFSLPIIIGLLTASFEKAFKHFLSFFIIYATIIHCLLVLCSIGNYFYYQTYSTSIDVFIFGLKDDDTAAILFSMWNDYPVIKSLLLTLFVSYIVFLINKILQKKQLKKPLSKYSRFNNLSFNVAVTFIFLILIFLFARGSMGTLPLKRYHANVSDYVVFNKVTPNALMLIDWAANDYTHQGKFHTIKEADYLHKMQQVLGVDNLLKSTPKNDFLAKNPPNIVIAMMESMGTSVLKFDGENEQMLGELQPHFVNDFVFERFYAQTYATIDTLVDMLANSNDPTIAASEAQRVTIPEAPMLVYKKAGYRTVFLYGGNAMWRNIYNYFPYQGFDEIYDENSIMNEYPEAKNSKGEWGLADEYLFKFTEKILKESTQPTVVLMMTVTNHSPHRLPNTTPEQKIEISNEIKSLAKIEGDKLHNMLQTYRYSSDVLGQFISDIKHSPLGEKTLIVATGDHRIRSMKMNSETQMVSASQVPFYLYIPDAILSHVEHSYQPLRVGSHKDVFPTLFNFSLSDSQYSSLGGENILSPDESVNYWGYSPEGVFNSDGAHLKSMPDKLMPWAKNSNNFLPAISDASKVTPSAIEYNELKTLYINKSIKGFD
ncbi:alkaline phosphatase family protein [Psychromonas sp. RZ22]|uniref:LTA synthase family protein n=1 Tax=Psychromonas algarum TaxID=2555643 RepID=UPI00106729F0|nr:alkaline phosphatase family protein [Psychromonas sp. RZ22]TEW56622.1 alkaline phosphatase family protein [Psychromonas sp. RZ22]